MRAFRVFDVIGGALGLLPRFGPGIYADYLAAGIVVSTLGALFAPEDLRNALTGTVGDDWIWTRILANPMFYVSGAVHAAVTAAAFARVYTTLEPQTGADIAATFRAGLLPLCGLSILVDLAFNLAFLVFFLAAVLIAALTSFLVPAVVVENAGWQGLARAATLARGHLLRLVGIWLAILVPWVVLLIWNDPRDPSLADASVTTLWLTDILSGIFAPLFSAFSLLCVLVAYRSLHHDQDRRLEDTFR
ncbi:MAG: hypothetical protein AAGE76_07110 [Pseudomonadota bacterium]